MKSYLTKTVMIALSWIVYNLAYAGTVTYVYTDPQGTPLAEADASGNVTAWFEYAPYGVSVSSMGAAPDGPGYTGHVNDPDTGLVYMQARYYDPAIGRFLSVDPVAPSAGSLYTFDRYNYANDNPIRYTDPDGRKCGSADGRDSCTFDEFKDSKGKSISREQALSSGSKLAKFFHVDMGSRILRSESAMTAKYSAAKGLAARGGAVTIKGNKGLGIPDQNVSGEAIVKSMETIQTIATAQEGPRISIAFTPIDGGAVSGHGPITFYRDGAKATDFGQTFGHEILHTIYSGAGLSNRGWANPDFKFPHQMPFNEASDAIH